jgi:hypothetical protein
MCVQGGGNVSDQPDLGDTHPWNWLRGVLISQFAYENIIPEHTDNIVISIALCQTSQNPFTSSYKRMSFGRASDLYSHETGALDLQHFRRLLESLSNVVRNTATSK